MSQTGSKSSFYARGMLQFGIMANIAQSLFREYDIRGREKKGELDVPTLELLGKGYGTFLAQRDITQAVVGHDNRATSEAFYEAVIRGLASTGCEIIPIGTVTTPMLYWAQYHFRVQGGCVVTASHNPVGWNGVKLAVGYSITTNAQELQEIHGIIKKESFVGVEQEGKVLQEENIAQAYMADLLSRVSGLKKFRVVVNTGNGTAGLFAPELFRQAGCEVVEHLTEPDSSYPHYTPNPAETEMMEDTARVVQKSHADFGLAFDGDGDRVGLVDEKGKTVWPDRYLILLSRLVLAQHPGSAVVFDVKSSEALPEDIAAHGGRPIMWKTGHSYIKEKMKEENAAIGGEMSGHVFFTKDYYGFDDAFFAALKLIEYFSQQEKPVSVCVADTPYYISSPALHAECPDSKKYQVVEDITKEFQQEYEVVVINGARVLFGDGAWGLVRASSNLPALVLRFEAKTKERMEEIEQVFRNKLKQYSFVSQDWYAA
jgi:phosphomannomutase / phosphoglucomutase